MRGLATYHGPAYLGWRSWRILPHDLYEGEPTVRLAASGRYGLPKLWEPRQPLRAVCGKFKTTHEAPWPDCQCGIHAYAECDLAEGHRASFVNNNGEGTLGWAFGRVSLWGRIVEHESGWRAEYAYPYELTVHGPPELADRIRSLYLIDVQQAPPLKPEPPEPEPGEPPIDPIGTALERVETKLETLLACVERAYPAGIIAPGSRIRLCTDEEVLVALKDAVESRSQKKYFLGVVPSGSVTERLVGNGYSTSDILKVAHILRRLERDGTVVGFRSRGSGVFWTLPSLAGKVDERIIRGSRPADLQCGVDDVLAALKRSRALTFNQLLRRLLPPGMEATASARGVLSARLTELRKQGLVDLTHGGPDGKTKLYARSAAARTRKP